MTTATTATTTAAAAAAATATAMAAALATAIAGPQTTINLSYRNGYVELDTKMFCGENYEEAATTGEPCPEEDCPEGQTYWVDVEHYGSGAEEEGEESDED